MAGFIPPENKKILLDLNNGKAAPTGYVGNRYVGLLTGLPEGVISMATVADYEVTTPGYARVQVTMGDASTVEPIQATNTVSVQGGPVTADMVPGAPYAFLTNVLSGTTGILLYVWELAEPVAALAQKPFFIPASGLVIE